MVFCVLYPFWVIWMMNKNFEKIAGKDEEFEERFGALWEGLNVNEEDGDRKSTL